MTCPACGAAEFRTLESIDIVEQHKFYAPNDGGLQDRLNQAAAESAFHYRMLKCCQCGLEWSDPLKAPSANWYQLAYRADNLQVIERWEFETVLDRMAQDATIFEFACGRGNFLQRCKRRNIKASGIDFSASGIAECRSLGLDAWQADLYLEDLSGIPRTTDIVAFHVVEHLDRPDALFEAAAAIAPPGAHLWISVPNDRRGTRIFGTRDYLDQPPHHMTRWTAEAFRQIGWRSGWKLFEAIDERLSLWHRLWSITVNSSGYLRLQASGLLNNRFLERAYRLLALPYAYVAANRKYRNLTGFSILVHFVREPDETL